MTQLLFPEALLGGPLGAQSRKIISRDEMNLAEFPLTVLSTRVDPSVKTLEFTDTVLSKNGESIERKWIITGADKFGLPTASDDEVLLGLMKLTVDSGFKERKVYFSRYELLRILRWTTEGRSYTRLQRALDRLSGVRIKASNAFYDNEAKSHSTRNFGIIEAYEINDGRTAESKPSFFSWSDVMFKSFQVGFIKKLDLHFYLSLESAVSKRLYRFLDKHFWYKSRLTMNLFVLAHEKSGISRNYQYASSLRQQIDPALDELLAQGFISSYDYQGKGKGTEITIQSAASKGRSQLRDEVPGLVTGGQSSAEERMRRAVEVLPRDTHSNALHGGRSRGVKYTGEQPDSFASSSRAGRDSFQNSHQDISRASATESVASRTLSKQSAPSANADRLHSIVGEEGEMLEEQVASALVARGIAPNQAGRLTRGRATGSLKRMLEIISHFDKLVSSRSKLVSRSPVGFLYRAVEHPELFQLPSDRGFSDRGFSNWGSDKRGSGERGLGERGISRATPHHQGALEFGGGEGIARSPAGRGRALESRASIERDRLTELQALYLEARRRAVQQMKSDVEPTVLTKMTAEVEQALQKLKPLISPLRFQETVEHGIEERLVKLFVYPDFDEWIQQQKLHSK